MFYARLYPRHKYFIYSISLANNVFIGDLETVNNWIRSQRSVSPINYRDSIRRSQHNNLEPVFDTCTETENELLNLRRIKLERDHLRQALNIHITAIGTIDLSEIEEIQEILYPDTDTEDDQEFLEHSEIGNSPPSSSNIIGNRFMSSRMPRGTSSSSSVQNSPTQSFEKSRDHVEIVQFTDLHIPFTSSIKNENIFEKHTMSNFSENSIAPYKEIQPTAITAPDHVPINNENVSYVNHLVGAGHSPNYTIFPSDSSTNILTPSYMSGVHSYASSVQDTALNRRNHLYTMFGGHRWGTQQSDPISGTMHFETDVRNA